MKKLHGSILGLLALLIGGCVLGSVQTFSAVGIRCTVVAADTGRPVERARISIECHPGNPGTKPLSYGPFFTDGSGTCQVEVPKESVWISGSEAFVGGYMRHLVVTADGFEDAGISEGFGLEKSSLSEIHERTFRLRRRVPIQSPEPTSTTRGGSS